MTDNNVFKLAQLGTFADLLTEVLRNGARSLLVQAVEAEVADFLRQHADKLTEDGRHRVVRHGHLPEREIMTGIGAIERQQMASGCASRRRFCLPMRVGQRASRC